MYEEDALQHRLAGFYADLPRRFPDQPIKIIDGTRSIEEVRADCLAAILALLEGKTECAS
jgi:thymidylate kinase